VGAGFPSEVAQEKQLQEVGTGFPSDVAQEKPWLTIRASDAIIVRPGLTDPAPRPASLERSFLCRIDDGASPAD
jgi:hypothetical protein